MAHAPAADRGRGGPAKADVASVPSSLAELYRRYSGFVWRVVRRLGVPEPAVEDVMQDVFIVVHRRLSEYDGRAAMTTWLYNLTRGVVSNYKRGRTREERRLSLVRATSASPADPEAQTERHKAASFVRQFLATLDEDKRRVFELVEVEGLAVTEAAALCDVNVNTAYSRLRAARLAFAEAVKRYRSIPQPRSTVA